MKKKINMAGGWFTWSCSITLKENYKNGGFGYGHAKKELLDYILTKFSLEREKFNYYMSNLNEIDEALNIGAVKARQVAKGVLNRVREKLGYN